MKTKFSKHCTYGYALIAKTGNGTGRKYNVLEKFKIQLTSKEPFSSSLRRLAHNIEPS